MFAELLQIGNQRIHFGFALKSRRGIRDVLVGVGVAEGFQAKVMFAQGDARKMILRATEERHPDVLVMARHSYKPDGNFLTRRLDALVEEFDHMTFGSVSAFLARRVQCPLLIIPTHAE